MSIRKLVAYRSVVGRTDFGLEAALLFFDHTESRARPVKTIETPAHCCGVTGWPNQTIERRMVKNFRDVVVMDSTNAPKFRTRK